MADIIVIGILAIIIGASVTYIVRAKRCGVKCIGCPAGGQCSGKSGGQCGCAGGVERIAEE